MKLFAPLLLLAATAQGGLLTGLRVSGNGLVDGVGRPVVLHGASYSGTEFACIQGWGFYGGPADPVVASEGLGSWPGMNVVRVPLNEGCWLGINGAPAAFSGANYKAAIQNLVTALHNEGLAVILELHWSGAGTDMANGQQPMPNRDHTPTFWTEVANAYKGDGAVIFDLFNEPLPDNNQNTNEAWRCWRDGGTCAGMSFQAAGMQELVTTVRGTGAANLILLGGVQYGGNVGRWVEHAPADPLNNIAASLHIYDFTGCTNQACWDAMIAPTTAAVPLVVGEIGDHPNSPCDLSFSTALLDWLDARHVGHLAWNWNVWGGCLDLISNYDGTPSAAWGAAYKARLTTYTSGRDGTPPARPQGLRVR